MSELARDSLREYVGESTSVSESERELVSE
jgi:hypothetical protein